MTRGPDAVHVAHWRRQVAMLYAQVRDAGARAGESALVEFRAARDRLFAMHPASPLDAAGRATFAGLDYFEFDPQARVDARLEPVPEAPAVIVDLGPGCRLACRPVAVAHFSLYETPRALTLYALDGYAGGVWLPFRDATSGQGSYGGGRYLYDTVKGADLGLEGTHLPLDFNYAYNPSCAYSSRWVCPLPPRENELPVAVRAGERVYAG